MFEGLVNLKTLYLSKNQIESIPLDMFEGLDSLMEINLSKNLFILWYSDL